MRMEYSVQPYLKFTPYLGLSIPIGRVYVYRPISTNELINLYSIRLLKRAFIRVVANKLS